MIDLQGTYVPLVTPFTDDGDSLSEVRLARLVRHFLQQGAEGFIVCTDIGEFTTTSTGERKQVLEIVLREAQGTPVLTNVTRLGTLQALDLAQHAARHGARAAAIIPPYYEPLSDGEVENHFHTIATHAKIPLIVVDPHHRVTATMRQSLKDQPNLFFANTTLNIGTSAFTQAALTVSPLPLLTPMLPSGTEADLKALLEAHHPTALCKAALDYQDLEVGPPRRPVQVLSPEVRHRLIKG